MVAKIRLTRIGKKKRPCYKIVVADSKKPRDGVFIDQVGSYSPLMAKGTPNRVTADKGKVQYWLSVGAQPTSTVASILKSIGCI